MRDIAALIKRGKWAAGIWELHYNSAAFFQQEVGAAKQIENLLECHVFNDIKGRNQIEAPTRFFHLMNGAKVNDMAARAREVYHFRQNFHAFDGMAVTLRPIQKAPFSKANFKDGTAAREAKLLKGDRVAVDIFRKVSSTPSLMRGIVIVETRSIKWICSLFQWLYSSAHCGIWPTVRSLSWLRLILNPRLT